LVVCAVLSIGSLWFQPEPGDDPDLVRRAMARTLEQRVTACLSVFTFWYGLIATGITIAIFVPGRQHENS
jgi:hypothetical protein